MGNSKGLSEEIGLVELLILFKREQKLIWISVAAALILATAYVSLTKWRYRTELQIGAPSLDTLSMLGVPNEFRPNGNLFQQAVGALGSKTLRREYFDKKGLYHHLTGQLPVDVEPEEVTEVFYQRFDSKISMSPIGEGPDIKAYVVSMDFHEPKMTEKWLFELATLANEQIVGSAVSFMEKSIENKRATLQKQIQLKNELIKREWESATTRLAESESIANRLSLSRSVFVQPDQVAFSSRQTVLVENGQLSSANSDEMSDLSSPENLSYFRGSQALRAEINAIKARKDPASFDHSVRKLMNQLKMLEAFDFKSSYLIALHVDQAPYTHKDPVKPQVLVIFPSAVVLGLIFGIVLVFSKTILGIVRETEANS
ncbi:MAG: hypothetical protein COT74_11205 [Bdellovibrionales bacterium CG10_big_fil_rev_8_21_14_0_10_45_34]|nr:MAG: hypothetical protein COT74_11205 [Bdellovibrionales bacterium CG10_big_fil_rev_8_21_14_0_10_45_34]